MFRRSSMKFNLYPQPFLKMAPDGGADGKTADKATDDGKAPDKSIEILTELLKPITEKFANMEAVLANLIKANETKKEEPKKEEPKINEKGELNVEALVSAVVNKVSTVFDAKFSEISKNSFESSLTKEDKEYLKTIPHSDTLPIETQKYLLSVKPKEKEKEPEKKSKSATVGGNSSGNDRDLYKEANEARKKGGK